jgi:hypothetical protein
MSELERLEARADVLMRHVEANSKKIRQAKLKKGEWDTRRIEATLRIMQELVDLSQMINELWEQPELVA